MTHFRRCLLILTAIFAAGPSVASAHPAYQDQMKRLAESKIPEKLDLSRIKSGTSFTVRYAPATASGDLPVAELQSWIVTVVPAPKALEVEADMPQHLYGLGSVPKVKALGGGKFRVDGLNFQMPGWWQVVFKVQARDGEDEAVRFDLVL